MSQASASGCWPSVSQVAEELDPWAVRRLAVLKRLIRQRSSLLGMTEPTLCGRASKRLHEKTPPAAEIAEFHTLTDLLFHIPEYAQVQHQLGLTQATQQLQLPQIVQYDLFHLTEALPQDRAIATTDQQHSFFFRADAEAELWAHIKAYHAHGVIPCLMWHTFHPLLAKQDSASVLQQNAHPFGLQGVTDEFLLLRFLAHHVHLPRPEWPEGLSADQRVMLSTFQDKLNRIAHFAKVGAEEGIVFLFRPFHEANGHWFWWSIRHFAQEHKAALPHMKALWVNTRRYLEEVKGVSNLLYVWSPSLSKEWVLDEQSFQQEYLAGIDPATVDVMGLDCYPEEHIVRAFTQNPSRAGIIQQGLERLAFLKRSYPDKAIGFTEIGTRYHRTLVHDDPDVGLGDIKKGGGSLSPDLLWQFSANNPEAPHFAIWWRNEPDALEFPLPGFSMVMDQEAITFWQHWDTQLADIPDNEVV